MGKYLTDINVIFALKGAHRFPAKHRITEQIILGTPGTTLDWVKRRFFDPSLITMFVLDEADVMIATQGHQDQTVGFNIFRNYQHFCNVIFRHWQKYICESEFYIEKVLVNVIPYTVEPH